MTHGEFEQVMLRYEHLVYTVCHQLVRDNHLAQDLCQETFLAVWLHAAGCPAQENSRRNWICRVAANKAKDYLKSAHHRRMVCTEAPGETAAAGTQVLRISDMAEQMEMREAGREACVRIGALAEPYRTVCTLYFLYGVPAETIARKLRRPVKTVYTQLYRARLRIKKGLQAG